MDCTYSTAPNSDSAESWQGRVPWVLCIRLIQNVVLLSSLLFWKSMKLHIWLRSQIPQEWHRSQSDNVYHDSILMEGNVVLSPLHRCKMGTEGLSKSTALAKLPDFIVPEWTRSQKVQKVWKTVPKVVQMMSFLRQR